MDYYPYQVGLCNLIPNLRFIAILPDMLKELMFPHWMSIAHYLRAAPVVIHCQPKTCRNIKRKCNSHKNSQKPFFSDHILDPVLCFNVNDSIDCNQGTPNERANQVSASGQVRPVTKLWTKKLIEWQRRQDENHFSKKCNSQEYSVGLIDPNELVDWTHFCVRGSEIGKNNPSQSDKDFARLNYKLNS